MSSNPVKVGIVGLGRWAKVLTRAARTVRHARDRRGLQPLRGEARRRSSRSSASRRAPDLATLLADPEIKGVILTVPNEQHLPLAREVAKAGKHVYTEKPIASTLEEGLEIEALEKTYGVTVTVGHSARLMAGIREIREAIDAGELGRVAFIEANFSNERALELTPQDVALVQGPRAGRAAVAARDPSVRRAALSRRRDRRGQLDGVEAVAGRRRGRRPVDDAAALRRRQDRLCRLVLDLARHLLRCACSAPRA